MVCFCFQSFEYDNYFKMVHQVGNIWPKVLVPWNDKYSDRALKVLVFHGLGQHRVTKLENTESDGSYYVLKTNFMEGLEVRQGFAKYGADAYFDNEGNPVKIIRQNKSYTPKDGHEWEYAKFAFRGSLQVLVTAVDHLVGIHMITANRLVTASREALAPSHPLRRLLKPFTFRSVRINMGAAETLFAHKGMLQRAFALTDKGMFQTWDYAISVHKYEPILYKFKNQEIDTITMPLHEDGLDYWNIVKKFVTNYISHFYPPTDNGRYINDHSYILLHTFQYYKLLLSC